MTKPYGIHDEEGVGLVPLGGWCLALTELSKNPAPRHYDTAVNWLVRLNWGYGSTGTIPLPQDYDSYLNSLTSFVSGSSGVHAWIIGNEPNHEQERPGGVYITPEMYANFFILVRNHIKTIDSGSRVIPAPCAPYHANPIPWTDYLRRMMLLVERQGGCDGLAVHAYTRSSNPADIHDPSIRMVGGFLKGTFAGFLTYRDAFAQLPDSLLRNPAWVTEACELLPDGWEDSNTGVVRAMYDEIAFWNEQGGYPKIQGLTLYRYPTYDKWSFQNKQGVIEDFNQAVEQGKEAHKLFMPSIKSEVDPRAVDRKVRVQPVPTGRAWRVVKLNWLDEQQSQGRHHLLFDTLDEQGQRVAGVSLLVRWPSGEKTVISQPKPGEPYSADFPMSPSRNDFSVRVVDSIPSETVEGLGMGADTPGGFNAGIHTSTEIVFQLTGTASSELPPLLHPVGADAPLSQRFGENPDEYSRFVVDGVPLRGHTGLDFAVPLGTPVYAAAEGRVVEMADDVQGYGLYIKLRHSWGESLYAHLSQQGVRLGQMVRRGELLGASGSSGNSTGPHLHFAIRTNPYNRQDGWGGYTDPLPYFAKRELADEEDVVEIIEQVADETGVDFHLLLSLAWAESSFRPEVENGLFQVGDQAWQDWAESVGATNRNDPLDNSRVAAVYLRWLVAYFNNDLEDALKAYNWGASNVLRGDEAPLATTIYVYKVLHGRDLLKAIGV